MPLEFKDLEEVLTGEGKQFTIHSAPNRHPNFVDVLAVVTAEVLKLKQQLKELEDARAEAGPDDETSGSGGEEDQDSGAPRTLRWRS